MHADDRYDAQPPPPPAPPRPSFWLRLFLVILLLGLGGSLLLNFGLIAAVGVLYGDFEDRVREKTLSGQLTAPDKVAVITIDGVLTSADGYFRNQIARARKDESVKAVVLRVASPGGTIAASDEIYHLLRRLAEERKIPIVVSMGSIAASGGYYVSMAVGDTPEAIYAEPATWTGSIGVIIPHYNMAQLMEKVGVQEDSVASDRLKHMGTITRPMTDEERKIFQTLVDESFGQFKEVIREGRPKFRLDPKALDRLATGQIYSAAQAQKAGLVDRIGFREDAVKRAIELARLKPANVRVVQYRRELDLWGSLFQSRAHGPDLAMLLGTASPQAYYLYTSLPPLAESALRHQGR